MNECRKIAELESRIVELESKHRQIEQQFEDIINKPLSQSAAAKYLHISRNTLAKHTDMGLLSPIPGTTKYRASELDRYRAIRKRNR